jgi:hypothetical protein
VKRREWSSALALIAVGAYIVGSALSLPLDVPLVLLALLGGLVLILDRRGLPGSNQLLFALVFAFLTSRLISTVRS